MEGVADTSERLNNAMIRFTRLKGSGNYSVDNISNLPDSILLHILSFLPIEEAVKTILHRRFGNLWTSVQTLNFDARAYNNFSDARRRIWFTNFVSHVLLLHECPTIFKFSLKFGSNLYFLPMNIKPRRHRKPVRVDFANNIDNWICFALRKKVQVLNLGILAHESSSSRFDYDLPDKVLISDSLKEMTLVNIGLRQQKPIHMKMLKVLSLTTIMLDDVMSEGILSGCPILEKLSIIKCYGLRKLNCMSKHLKSLTVDVGEYSLPGLEISGPYLTSVHILGIEAPVDLRNLLSLVEASLDLCFGGRPEDKHSSTGVLLEKLHHASTFTISDWCILVLSFLNLTDVPCPSSRRNTLILNTQLTNKHLPGITTLLRTSSNLERLIIYIEADATVSDEDNDLQLGLPGHYREIAWTNELRLQAYEIDDDKYLNSQEPFSCLTNHLKYVKISGAISISNPCLEAFIRFLLCCSNVLEEMEIISTCVSCQFLSEESLKFSQMLSRCPKASAGAVLRFT